MFMGLVGITCYTTAPRENRADPKQGFVTLPGCVLSDTELMDNATGAMLGESQLPPADASSSSDMRGTDATSPRKRNGLGRRLSRLVGQPSADKTKVTEFSAPSTQTGESRMCKVYVLSGDDLLNLGKVSCYPALVDPESMGVNPEMIQKGGATPFKKSTEFSPPAGPDGAWEYVFNVCTFEEGDRTFIGVSARSDQDPLLFELMDVDHRLQELHITFTAIHEENKSTMITMTITNEPPIGL